ncbi:hypothetical protein ES332_D10G307000v1 [Gossypium tomentosum]|uniref:F-box domain-containing protein n=1 Tax=Gossypium tomentosum TaxID=34277 RepID=A0A5D2JCP8_GOSTO|nr:hypothetical protein ES332_D10G307000v1 [Gossypium tomentosum]
MPRFEVPEALVMEILSKLPVKSLTRFNCVCKYWCSFFRTPHFISKHYHNNVKNNNLNLVLQRHDHGTANMPYFSQSHTYACVYFNHGAFVFDSKADDYKFIRFVTVSFVNTEYENEFAENMSQVELYSLKCDSWKEISSPNYTPYGICYWETTMGYYPDEKELIFSFDMANEKFSVSPIPKFFESYREHYIQVLEYGINNSALNLFRLVLFDPSSQEFKVNRVPINGIQEHKDHIICQLVGDAPNKY